MPDWDSRNSAFPTLMGTIGYESRLKLLSDSIPGTGVDCQYGAIPYHPTTLDLRKRISTTLIEFNGNDTGYSLWNDDEYQPVTNRDRLQVLLSHLYFFACQIPLFFIGSYLPRLCRKLYECLSMISDIDEVPDTPHLILPIYFKAPLGRSLRPDLLPDTRPLLRTRLAPS